MLPSLSSVTIRRIAPHRLLRAGRVDDEAVVGLEQGHADRGVLIEIQHLAAAPLDGAALGELGVVILLVVIVHDVLQLREVIIIRAAIYHGPPEEIPGSRVRDVLGDVADDAVIGGCAVLLMAVEDTVVAEIILLQLPVLASSTSMCRSIRRLNACRVQRLI